MLSIFEACKKQDFTNVLFSINLGCGFAFRQFHPPWNPGSLSLSLLGTLSNDCVDGDENGKEKQKEEWGLYDLRRGRQ